MVPKMGSTSAIQRFQQSLRQAFFSGNDRMTKNYLQFLVDKIVVDGPSVEIRCMSEAAIRLMEGGVPKDKTGEELTSPVHSPTTVGVKLAHAYETRTWVWPFKVLEFRTTAKQRSKKTARPQRRLSALERARKLQEMLDREPGLTRAELARRLGISRARVTQILGALDLGDVTGRLSERAARGLRGPRH